VDRRERVNVDNGQCAHYTADAATRLPEASSLLAPRERRVPLEEKLLKSRKVFI